MEQLPAPITLPNLDNFKLAKLANEVAMDVRPIVDILPDYGITPAQYDLVKVLPYYRDTLEQSQLEWKSAKSVHERLRLQSAIMLEEAFPVLGARMRSRDEPLPAAVETAKLMAKITGLGEATKAMAGDSGRFSITINLGADTKGNPETIKLEADIAPKADPLQIEATKVDKK